MRRLPGRQKKKKISCKRLYWCTVTPGTHSEQRVEQIPKESKPVATQGPPSPEAERQVSDSQSQKARGCCNLSLRDLIFRKLWAGSQLLIMSSQDAGRLTLARSVTGWDQLSRGDIFRTVLSGHTPGIWVTRTGEVIMTHSSPGTVHSPSTWSPELFRPGKDTKHTAHPDLCPCRAPETLSSLDLGSARNSGTSWNSALVVHPGA